MFKHWYSRMRRNGLNIVLVGCPLDSYPTAVRWLADHKMLATALARTIGAMNGDAKLLALVPNSETRHLDICMTHRHYDVIAELYGLGLVERSYMMAMAHSGPASLLSSVLSSGVYADRMWLINHAVSGENIEVIAWLATEGKANWDGIENIMAYGSGRMRDWWSRWKNHHRDERRRKNNKNKSYASSHVSTWNSTAPMLPSVPS